MIYEHDDGTCGISSHGMWLPGNYADKRAARYAFRFSNADLERLNATRGTGMEYRPIRFEDLQEWRRATTER